MKGRLLVLSLGDPYSNVAFEEALLKAARVPTLRVWENQRSVVIGRGQSAEHETDLRLCRAGSIPVVRRFTAGGAVYNGPGNLNWSFVVPGGGGARESLDANGVFSEFAGMVVKALRGLGVEAEFIPPNTVATREGKVSGMAAYVSRTGTLCHGTLLVDADLGEVESLTTPADVELPRRYPRSRHTKVANCGVAVGKFVERLSSMGGGYETDGASEEELDECSRLVPKYASDAWNFADPFA